MTTNTSERRDYGTSDHPMTRAEMPAAPRVDAGQGNAGAAGAGACLEAAEYGMPECDGACLAAAFGHFCARVHRRIEEPLAARPVPAPTGEALARIADSLAAMLEPSVNDATGRTLRPYLRGLHGRAVVGDAVAQLRALAAGLAPALAADETESAA